MEMKLKNEYKELKKKGRVTDLSTIHDKFVEVSERGYPLSFIFFRDDQGNKRNIIYNQGQYLEMLDNKKFYRLCPLGEVEVWINKLLLPGYDYKLVGVGHLKKKLLLNEKSLISRKKAFKYKYMEGKEEVVS